MRASARVDTLLAICVACLGLWLTGVLILVLAGRRADARALAGFGPDCAVLCARVARDRSLARRLRLTLLCAAAYLASPIDLVPDFIPVAGQLDDVLVAAAALRQVLRHAGPEAVRRHWPGPERSLALVLRLAR